MGNINFLIKWRQDLGIHENCFWICEFCEYCSLDIYYNIICLCCHPCHCHWWLYIQYPTYFLISKDLWYFSRMEYSCSFSLKAYHIMISLCNITGWDYVLVHPLKSVKRRKDMCNIDLLIKRKHTLTSGKSVCGFIAVTWTFIAIPFIIVVICGADATTHNTWKYS